MLDTHFYFHIHQYRLVKLNLILLQYAVIKSLYNIPQFCNRLREDLLMPRKKKHIKLLTSERQYHRKKYPYVLWKGATIRHNLKNAFYRATMCASFEISVLQLYRKWLCLPFYSLQFLGVFAPTKETLEKFQLCKYSRQLFV